MELFKMCFRAIRVKVCYLVLFYVVPVNIVNAQDCCCCCPPPFSGVQSSDYAANNIDAFFQPPVISGGTSICSGQSITLNSNTGYSSYSWAIGNSIIGNSQSVLVSPTITSTYTLAITNGNGCSLSKSVIVKVNDIPPITTSASSPVICLGSSTTLTALSELTTTGLQILPLGYCSAPHNGFSPCINLVSFGSINNNTTASGCALPAYTNFPQSSGASTNLVTGSSYNLGVTLSSNGYAYAWIDWNRNGIYDPSTEYYNLLSAAINGNVSITVPLNASLGITSMRIRSRALPSSSDACASYGSGETEDYSINVTNISANPNVSFNWNPGGAGNSIFVSPVSNTTYFVIATNGLTGCSNNKNVPVMVINSPVMPIAFANPNSICINTITSLFVAIPQSGVTYNWESSPTGAPGSWNLIGGGSSLQTPHLNLSTFFRVNASCGTSPTLTSNPVFVNVTPCAGQNLFVKLFIEGYYSGGGIMDNVGSSPFGGLLYHEGITSDPNDVDYVTLSLMGANTPHDMVESQTGVLKVDGKLKVTFSPYVPTAFPYYIRVTHRNALEIWSSQPLFINSTSVISPYDFTTAASKAYGSNQADLGDGNWAIFSGDVSDANTSLVGNHDGIIESQDYGDMESAVYQTLIGYVFEDITGDGVVESADYGLIENNVYFTRVAIRP